MGKPNKPGRGVHSKRVAKEKILERKADELLKIDERNQRLKEKILKIDPFSFDSLKNQHNDVLELLCDLIQ